MAGESRVNQQGFSLIEVLVVSGLSTMLLLTVTAVFMTFMTGSASTNISRTLSREGDSALNQLEYVIRNAHTINCFSNRVEVTSEDGSYSRIQFDSNQLKIMFDQGAHAESAPPRVLTSSNVDASGTLSCTPAGRKQYVDITLILQKLDQNGMTVGQPETFTTSIQARN